MTVPGEHDEVGVAEDLARGAAGLRVVRHGEADEAGGVGDHCRCHAELGEHLLGEHRAALLVVFGPAVMDGVVEPGGQPGCGEGSSTS